MVFKAGQAFTFNPIEGDTWYLPTTPPWHCLLPSLGTAFTWSIFWIKTCSAESGRPREILLSATPGTCFHLTLHCQPQMTSAWHWIFSWVLKLAGDVKMCIIKMTHWVDGSTGRAQGTGKTRPPERSSDQHGLMKGFLVGYLHGTGWFQRIVT